VCSSDLLACPRRAFDRGFELLAEAVLRPAFTPDVVERTRERVISSLSEGGANVDEAIERTIAAEIYRGHPYAPPDKGTVESLRNLTIDDLRAHHQSLLQGARLLVVVVGRVDPADVRRKVRAAFGQIPAGDSLDVEVPVLAFDGPTVRRFPVKGSPTVRGIFAVPPADAPDLPSLHLAVAILNVRLFTVLRQKHSLAYYAGASLPSGRAVYGTIRAQTDDPNQAAGLIVDELTRLASEAPPAREVKAAVAQVWNLQYIETQTNAAQAAALVRAELAGLGWRGQRMRFDDVTPETVQAAARKWLRHLQWFVFAEPNAPIDESRLTDPR
jgi:zinc protease